MNQTFSPHIAVLGDINIDVLLPIETYPQPGGEAVARHALTSLGGSAANTAVVLARLGCQVSLIGRVGKDVWGEIVLEALAGLGVDLAGIQRDQQAATGMMFTLVTPDGERTMFGHRGANTRTDPALITEKSFHGNDWLHLSGYALLESPQKEAARRAVVFANRMRLPISLDTAYLPALTMPQELKPLLNQLALCILGREEAEALTGTEKPKRAAQLLIESGIRALGLKLGAQGCLVADSQSVWEIPPFPARAVDTTGAGDAFSAGLIYGLLNGLSLPAAGVIANGLGSLAVQTLGAGDALPGREEVRKLLMENLATADAPCSGWIGEALAAIGG